MPKLAVNWNAAGGIFDQPTIFDTRAGLQGVGEAGPEAILPLNRETLGGIGQRVAKTMDAGNQGVEEMLMSILDAIVTKEMDIRVEMDKREVGRMVADEIDKKLGSKQINRNYYKGRL